MKHFKKQFQSMENIRSRSRSESRGRFASRPGSRATSRDNSRDRGQRGSSRERRKQEMRPVNFDNLENPDSQSRDRQTEIRKNSIKLPNDDSSDDSNWDQVLNKNSGES